MSIAVVLGLAIVGCSRDRAADDTVSKTHTTSGSVAAEAERSGASADNTERNEIDRRGLAVTPMDQGNDQADLDLTQAIRQSVIGDSTLSMTAKNVKIIAKNGKVTLRGPVLNAREHDAVVQRARRVAGMGNIEDQLEVKTP